jgi:cyclic pyranopterin phosphate synthase
VVNLTGVCKSGRPVPTLTIESAVYSFEGLLPELESPPIAARRALDHAGLRLSVEGWRSLAAEEREKLTLAGVPDRVDGDLVASLLRRAVPAPLKVASVADPDPSTPPDALVKALEPNRSIEAKRWARLRAVDRYALAHTYRRAVARSAFSLLGDALDAVLLAAAPAAYDPPAHPRRTSPSAHFAGPPASASPGGPYQPAGYYSSYGASPAPADVAAVSQRDPARADTSPRPPASPFPPAHDGGVPSRPPGDTAPRSTRSGSAPPHQTPTTPRNAVNAANAGPAAPAPASLSNHLNQAGELHMVDVARKPKTERRAVARGAVRMRAETLARLAQRDTPKGEVLAAARLSAILAAKRTHEIIPLCHMVALTHVEVILELDTASSAVQVTAVADAYDRTGCEMEAMVAVSTACLTLYDMLKGIDREMVIADIMLVEKSGGRSGDFRRAEVDP